MWKVSCQYRCLDVLELYAVPSLALACFGKAIDGAGAGDHGFKKG